MSRRGRYGGTFLAEELPTHTREQPRVTRSEIDDALRLREYFPETMLWQPQLITDDSGKAVLKVPFADSITTWRLSGMTCSSAQVSAARRATSISTPDR